MPGSNNRSSYEGVFGSSDTPSSAPQKPKQRITKKEDPLAAGNEKIKQEVAQRRERTGKRDLGEVRSAEQGDFRSEKSFSKAFAQARKMGLETFQWGKGTYKTQLAGEVSSQPARRVVGPSTLPSAPQPPVPSQPYSGLDSGQEPASGDMSPEAVVTASRPVQNLPNVGYRPNVSVRPMNVQSTGRNIQPSQPRRVVGPVEATTARYTANNTVNGDFGIGRGIARGVSWLGKELQDIWNSRQSGGARPIGLAPGATTSYRKGGKLSNEEQEFAAYLLQISGATTEEELQKFILETGEDEMKRIYSEWESSEVIEAKLGAKLDYLKKLQGKCPEGYEVEKYLAGGCVKCRKKAEDTFKANCGGKAKRRITKKSKK